MGKIVAVAERNSFITALMEDHSLVEWDTIQNSYSKWTKKKFGSLEGITQLARGAEHSIALTKDGKIFAWGSGEFGQLGIDCKFSKTPIQVNGLPPIKSISATHFQNLALDSEGKVWRWGSEIYEDDLGSKVFLLQYTIPNRIEKKLPEIKHIISNRNLHLLLDKANKLWILRTDDGTQLPPKFRQPIKLRNSIWLSSKDSVIQIANDIEPSGTFLIQTRINGWQVVTDDLETSNPLKNDKEKSINLEIIIKTTDGGENISPEVFKIFTDPRSGTLPPLDVFEKLLRHLLVQGFIL